MVGQAAVFGTHGCVSASRLPRLFRFARFGLVSLPFCAFALNSELHDYA